jgi:hypothetical protein
MILKQRCLLLILFFISSASSFAAVCPSDPSLLYPVGQNCDDQCNGNQTCEPNDNDPETDCCFDMAAVPELPAWTGPFILATLFAAWEYRRISKRRALY